jgi:hypothetical protein
MKAPIVAQVSWLGLIVSLLPLLAVLGANAWLAPRWFPIAGVLLWLVAVLLARRLLTRAHRQGIRMVKAGRFGDAIPVFGEAYSTMCDRPWIDTYRWVLLGSCSRWSYREMAMCSQAFCYGQIGDGQRMKECYEKAMAEFPESILAASALRMIDSIARKDQNR